MTNLAIATQFQTQPINNTVTMTSKDIADLLNCRHDNVKVTVERLADRGVIQLPAMQDVKNHLGQSVSMYKIEKRDSYVIVAQLSPEFTAALVDRWNELEAQVAQPVIALPQNYIAALTALLEAEKAKEVMMLELQESVQQVEVLTPKAKALDLIGSTNDTYTLTEASKLLKMRLMDLTAWLKANGWIYGHNSQDFKPAAEREYQKHLILKINNFNGSNSTQVRVTAKGLALLAKRHSKEV